jgi:4'-phosphopantetheinyl transferase
VPNEFSKLDWRRADDDVALGDNEIHVWLVTTTDPDVNLVSCAALLSVDEQARAEKFIFDKDRRLYTVAHAALRSILSIYLKTAPTSIEFTAGSNGKPGLAGDLSGDLRFNLSHSGDRAMIAAVFGREIGVDIESVKEGFAFDEVAEHFFTAREVAALRALPSRLQRRAFYRCWTSKEAFLKAKGTGLSGELDEVEILRAGDEDVRIDARVPGWTLTELASAGEYEAALVVEGGPLPVSCYLWQPAIGLWTKSSH